MMSNTVGEYLDELFPNPKCELIYHTDYELLIAIVLSAQSTDKRVNECTKILFSKYKSLNSLKKANIEDIEEIIRPIGSYHKKSSYVHDIAKIIDEEYNGKVPIEREKLIEIPGVGRKTINVFLGEFYNLPAIAVDTHVERVSKRLKIAKKEDSVLQVEKKLMKFYPKEEWARRHLQMVLFGRYYCKAIKPNCKGCKLKDICIEKKKANF